MPRPLVSVVMPAYNAERWVGDAIDSVLSQTCPDWELVVVDDGSTDGTATVVQSYADNRIRLVQQKNSGPSGARNKGMTVARGKYISLLDADDWYSPAHLARTTAFLEAHRECSLVGTNFCSVLVTGEKRIGCRPNEILGRPGDGIIKDYFAVALRNRCFPVTCGTVIRREKVASLGGFDERLDGAEDREFQTRWALRSQFGYVDEVLGYYRTGTPGSVRKNLVNSIRKRVALWQKLTRNEPRELPCWNSYARYRSYFMFRLVAVAVAAGQFDEASALVTVWPHSPNHVHWWIGRALVASPRLLQQAIHMSLGRLDFVRNRQGRSLPADRGVDNQGDSAGYHLL